MNVEDDRERLREPGARKRKAETDLDLPANKCARKVEPINQLVEIPEDILYEILKQLEPLDVLHLAQIAKVLRSTLMSRSSSWIWKASRANVPDLPELPPHLSEPQYANLIFNENYCQFCGRQWHVIHVIWTAYTRTCTACLKKHFHVATDKWKNSYRDHLVNLRSYVPTIMVSKGQPKKTTFYHRDSDLRWKDAYGKAANKLQWVIAMIAERDLIDKHVHSCMVWDRARKDRRKREQEFVLQCRKDLVRKHVRELGWGDELLRLERWGSQLEDHRIVVNACKKELTEEGLSELDPFLNSFMENAKQRRLGREHDQLVRQRLPALRSVLKDYVSKLPPNSVYPSVRDFCQDPLVSEMIGNAPRFVRIFDKNLGPIISRLPEIILRWKQNASNELLTMIRHVMSTYNQITYDVILRNSSLNHIEALDLAIINFQCSSCRYGSFSFRYPEVLMHDCSDRSWANLYTGQFPNDKLNKVVESTSWNQHKITLDLDAMVLLADIVKLCGFSPKTTTASDMDLANPLIECMECNMIDGRQVTMRWTDVVSHTRFKHKLSKNKKFAVFNREGPID